MACIERVFAVNGRYSHENAGIEDGYLSNTMIESYMDNIPSLSDGGTDLLHLADGHGGIGFIFQFAHLVRVGVSK